RRPPDLLGLRITRYPDVARDFVVVRRQVLVGDWPVQRAAMLALDLEIVRQQAREIREVMQRGAADSPAGLIAIGDRMPALENEWAAGVLEAPPPGIRADEISGFPVRTLFQNDHLLPGFRQHRGIDRARRARADDDRIHFLGPGHLTISSRVRCAPCRGCREPRTLPWCRRPRRRRRCASRNTRTGPEVPATLRACSRASGPRPRAARSR